MMHSEASGASRKQGKQNPWPKNLVTLRPHTTQVLAPVARTVSGVPTRALRSTVDSPKRMP